MLCSNLRPSFCRIHQLFWIMGYMQNDWIIMNGCKQAKPDLAGQVPRFLNDIDSFRWSLFLFSSRMSLRGHFLSQPICWNVMTRCCLRFRRQPLRYCSQIHLRSSLIGSRMSIPFSYPLLLTVLHFLFCVLCMSL